MTRTGKIARLPRWVREQLNRRLADGEQGRKLVEWLNGFQEVREVLEEDFGGRPVNEQNLTEWKQGGYLDWVRHQEAREWTRAVSEEAGELAEEAGIVPLSDRLSAMISLALGKVIRDFSQTSDGKDGSLGTLLSLARELAVLRDTDHRALRLRMELEDRQRREEQREKLAEKAARRRAEWEPIHNFIEALSKETLVQKFTQGVDLETENELRRLLKMPVQCAKPAQQTDSQTQSNSIKPDQAS